MGNIKRRVPKNRLRKSRCLLRFRKQEVVELLELENIRQVTRWERGERLPSALNLLKLCVLYKTLPHALYPEHIRDICTDLDMKFREINGECKEEIFEG